MLARSQRTLWIGVASLARFSVYRPTPSASRESLSLAADSFVTPFHALRPDSARALLEGDDSQSSLASDESIHLRSAPLYVLTMVVGACWFSILWPNGRADSGVRRRDLPRGRTDGGVSGLRRGRR